MKLSAQSASLLLLLAACEPTPPSQVQDPTVTGGGTPVAATGGGGSEVTGGGAGAGTAGGGGGTVEQDAGADAGTSAPDAGTSAADAGTDAGVLTAASCFAAQYLNPGSGAGPNYDQFQPVIGSHCRGTNHQAITGVQRVVFLGDSVTVGTPPTNVDVNAVYRSILARKLAMHFNLPAPGIGWGGANPFSGLALPAETGAFASCSKWGARVDDLMRDGRQVEDCIPANKRHLKHLVVMTMGGNDIASLTKAGGGTSPTKTLMQLHAQAQLMIDDLRAAITWLKNPANVPGGVDVVFANNYEFTDGTGDVASCPGASLAGIEPWQDLQAQTALVVWIEEQYLSVARSTGTDMVFLLESFCGHGYRRNDVTGMCYRGPGQALWFDDTCIHPSNAGHAALADDFFMTIAE